jgi:L-lactate dehydrogenase
MGGILSALMEMEVLFMSECKCVNIRKVAIVGCGFVGSASAFALMQSGLFSEMVLIDVNRERAEGEALDIGHGVSFAGPMKIYAGDYEDIRDAAVIVITAGANQKPDETRLDLVNRNAGIMESVVKKIAEQDCKGILLIVSNPVDVLTCVAHKVSGFPPNRILGSGTVLDSARLKYHLGKYLGVDSRSVHAFIIGEHGDSEIAAWSSANVSGVPISSMGQPGEHFDKEENMEEMANQVKNSAYEIIRKKDATYYGIAMVVKRICQAIIRDEKSIFPVSVPLNGEYGIRDVVLSMPAVVGADGIERLLPISLDEKETAKLRDSAEVLREIIEGLNVE